MVIKNTERESVNDRIERVIADARRKFPQIFPGQNFDTHIWDSSNLISRTNRSQAVRLAFAKFPQTLLWIEIFRSTQLTHYLSTLPT